MNKHFDGSMLDGMTVVAAIIDSGSFAAAGEILSMTQSGVSRAVARLEARLAIRIFDRSTRSVTLTDEGRRLSEQVMPLLAELEDTAASLAAGRGVVRGRLRVTVDPFFSRLVLGPQLGGFIGRHPGLQLELITRHQLGDMIADGFDLAVRFGFPRPSTLVAKKLLETRVLTVATPAYLRRHGRPRTPADLAQHACVQFKDPETGKPFDWEFHRGKKKIVVPVTGQMTVNDAGTLHSICLADLAVIQTMEFGIRQRLADGSLVDLFPDWPDERFPLYALYPSRHHLPAKTRAFIDFIATLAP